MKRWPLVGLTLAALWLFVRGVPLEPIRLVEEGLIGLAVGIPLAFLFRRFYNASFHVPRAVGAIPPAVVYLVLFLRELLTANIDVAYRVLHPSLPIRPDVVELPLRVESDLAITTIANSITLTPGTLTMDYDEERNALYVHAISTRDRESVVAPIRRWEDYALRIFAEPLDPADPVPDPGSVEDDSNGEPTAAADAGGEHDGE
ncbi:MAG: Na+/H+ antiporter subunit E [Haloarculaceae archaeon]